MTSRSKSKLKYPLIGGTTSHYPDRALCPWCKKQKVFEPHSFAMLGCGALLYDDKKRTCGGSDPRMGAMLSLVWHGAHCGGKGKYRDVHRIIDIVDDVYGGQFGLYFCSFRCLKQWFNSAVDELEREVRKENVARPKTKKTNKVPIKPLSTVKLSKIWSYSKQLKIKKGTIWTVGYYCRDCGLESIWLVDENGQYKWSVDQRQLSKYFELIYSAKTRRIYSKKCMHF